jgi:leucyl aminopeptidase
VCGLSKHTLTFLRRKVGVVGKGLLFDTGGYNIKTQMMELMKFDCGGAAAVLGAAKAIDSLAPKGVEVHFIVAACEVIQAFVMQSRTGWKTPRSHCLCIFAEYD